MNGKVAPVPSHAMVLAAGLGTRMRPLSELRPKPLVEVMGRALIDHVLDRVAEAGIGTAVINVHYFADELETHLRGRQRPRVVVSDERRQLLGTGGGIANALPLLDSDPFLLVNADSLWLEDGSSNLRRLAEAFGPRSDALLLLAPTDEALGYDGPGDYAMVEDGRLQRRRDRGKAPYVYAGAAVLAHAFFAGAPAAPFALDRLLDRAERAGRLHGLRLQGKFLHVGTPAAIVAAEGAIRSAAV